MPRLHLRGSSTASRRGRFWYLHIGRAAPSDLRWSAASADAWSNCKALNHLLAHLSQSLTNYNVCNADEGTSPLLRTDLIVAVRSRKTACASAFKVEGDTAVASSNLVTNFNLFHCQYSWLWTGQISAAEILKNSTSKTGVENTS